ncbi:beta strand repeat-containing protein, partial [Candidatus Omnitrophota bacterium]
NRVTGTDPSDILGSLTCNGIFALINSNGISIGPNANIDVGSLIVSTRDITDSNFLAANYIFDKLSPEQADALLLNQGSINIRRGGFGVLIAAAIENQGAIVVPVGTIAMAAGDMVKVDIAAGGAISIAINTATASTILDEEGNPITDQIKNTGTLEADGGLVVLKAEAAADIFTRAINLQGFARADTLEDNGGVIKIVSSGIIEVNAKISTDTLIIGEEDNPAREVIMINSSEVKADSISIAAHRMNIRSLAGLTEIYRPEDIKFDSLLLEDNLITLQGEGINITYLQDSALNLKSNGTVATELGVIIQATRVKVDAREFGSIEVPLNIKADNTYINRINGNIGIFESTGLGSTILIRGPPEGFGSIIYSADTNLTLEADKIVLSGEDPTYFYSDMIFYNFECLTPGKEIYFEAGKTYTFLGDTTIHGIPRLTTKLYSSIEGQNWYISIPSGIHDINRISIRDSHNIGNDIICVDLGSNRGNSSGWLLDPTWLGDGGDNLWSEEGNWDGGIPGAGDPVTFDDAVSSEDSEQDIADLSIGSVTITNGYTGILTLTENLTLTGNWTQDSGDVTLAGAGSLTIGGNYSQTDATFDCGATTIDINGSFSLDGGDFTATSDVMTVAGSFTTANTPTFAHGSGVITFDGASTSDTNIDANGINFSSVTIDRSNHDYPGTLLTIYEGTTLPLGTVSMLNDIGYYDLTNNGEITVDADPWEPTIDGDFNNNGTLTLNGTTWNPTIYDILTNSGTIDATSLTSWTMVGDFTNADGGSVDMSNCDDFDFDNWGNTAGASFTNSFGAEFTAKANPTFNVEGSFVIDSGSTFSPTTNVTLALDGDWEATSTEVDAPNITFVNPVTISRSISSLSRTLTIAIDTTLPLTTVTLNNDGSGAYHLINNGAITVSAASWSVSVDGTFTNNGTITATSLTSWDMNGDFTNDDGGVVNMSSCTSFDFDAYGANSKGHFTNSSGADFTADSNPSFDLTGSFTIASDSTFTPTTNVSLAMTGAIEIDRTIDAPNITFADPVTINVSTTPAVALTFTIESGTTVPLDMVTITNSGDGNLFNFTNSGAITVSAASWSVSVDGTFTNSGTITSSNLTSWTMNGSFTNSATGSVDMSSCSSFDFNNYGDGPGDFTNSAGASFASAATPSFNALADVTVDSGSTFPALGTFTLDRASGTQELDASSLTCTSFVKSAGSSLTLSSGFAAGGFTFSGGTISDPASAYTITVSGAFLQSSANTLGGGNLTLEFTGSDPQTIEKTAGTFSSIVDVDKAGDAVTLESAFAAGDDFTITQGTVATAGFALTVSGTFSNYGTLKLYGNEAHSPPTNYGGSLVQYYGTSGPYNVKEWTYDDIQFSSASATTHNLQALLTVNDDLTIDASNTLDVTGSNWGIDIKGDWDNNGVFTSGTGIVDFKGTTAQQINSGGYGDDNDFGSVTISNTSAAVTVSSEHMKVNNTLQVDGSTIFTLAANAQVWMNAGTLTLTGTPTYNAASCILNHNAATYDYYGGSTGINKDTLISDFDNTDNVTIKQGVFPQNELAEALSLTIDTGATYTVSTGNLDVGGNLDIDGTLNGANTILVAGNWDNGGTFEPGSSSVTLDGTDQSILGSSTFNDLTKTGSGQTLTFEAGSTQTITGTTTLQGNSTISLRSSTDGVEWNIDPQGEVEISSVDVQDSYNMDFDNSGSYIEPLLSIDSGNNYGWFSPAGSDPDPQEQSPENEDLDLWEEEVEEEEHLSYGLKKGLDYTEGEKYSKSYPKGKYRTVVIVFEGCVTVTPYEETGPIEEEAVILTDGQRASQDGFVK